MATDEDKVGQLEAEALKRKERLAALKRKQNSNHSDGANSEKEALPKPQFRSYKPQDEELKQAVLPSPDLPNLEEQVEEELKQAKAPAVVEELDLENLAPRKPDWDLKRDIAKKLEKLERRTQRSIAELIRDRLRENKEDLASAVSDATAAASMER